MVKSNSFFRILDPKKVSEKTPKKQNNFYPKKQKIEGKERE